MNMKVKELMTPNPTVVKPEDTAAQAATLMKQEDCGALPVVANGKLVGIITDRDSSCAPYRRGRIRIDQDLEI